jgi:hypothetical protein
VLPGCMAGDAERANQTSVASRRPAASSASSSPASSTV